MVGFKKEDYVDPEKILGVPAAEMDLPSDIKFFLKRNKNPPGGIQKKVYLYEMIREEGGLKFRLDHCDTFLNRLPEEEEIGLRFGPSDEGYRWIAKWLDINGNEVGMQSEIIRISEKWRARHEAYKRSEATQLAPPAAAALPVIPSTGNTGFGPMEILAYLREGEDRAVKMMERMAGVLKSVEGPSAVMEKAYDAVGRFMEKSMQSNMKIADKVAEDAQARIDRSSPMDDEDEEDETAAAPPAAGDGMPVWLKPIMDKAADGLGHLLGGGPTAAVVKSMIISSKEWKEIFADKDKFSTMTAAMREEFGDAQVEKAMGILLNKRPEKPLKKKAGK